MVFRLQPRPLTREVSPASAPKEELNLGLYLNLDLPSTAKRKAGCDIERNTVIDLPNSTGKKIEQRSAISSGQFRSVLSQPFARWNDIETAIMLFEPDWTPKQRGSLIESLTQFLELRISMEEYIPSHLLAPTRLVERAWRAVILDTRLYRKVCVAIQAFHNKPKKPVHYSILEYSEEHTSEYFKKVRRTQSLMKTYYGTEMPESLDDAESVCSAGDTSTLTDVMGRWQGIKSTFSGFGNFNPEHIQKKIQCSIDQVVSATYQVKEPEQKRQRTYSPPQSTTTRKPELGGMLAEDPSSVAFEGTSCIGIFEETLKFDDEDAPTMASKSIVGTEEGVEVSLPPPTTPPPGATRRRLM
jgi:hypothetical protein